MGKCNGLPWGFLGKERTKHSTDLGSDSAHWTTRLALTPRSTEYGVQDKYLRTLYSTVVTPYLTEYSVQVRLLAAFNGEAGLAGPRLASSPQRLVPSQAHSTSLVAVSIGASFGRELVETGAL
jgi:hypothetical protein